MAVNRVIQAISRQTALTDQRKASGAISPEQWDRADAAATFTFEEHADFQARKSVLAGTALTVEEAQTVYVLLGETPSVANAQPLATRAVLLNLYQEILSRAIPAARKQAAEKAVRRSRAS